MPDDLSAYLRPCSGFVLGERNATDRSRLANRIVATFLASSADAAQVRCELTPYRTQALYKSLWQVTCNAANRGRVRVRKSGERVWLERVRRHAG